VDAKACERRWQARADGKIAWSRPPDAEVKRLRDDLRARRWLTSPAHRGDRDISRKPSRRECRHVRRTCHDLRACLLPFLHARLRVRSASGIPCALSISRADVLGITRAFCAAGMLPHIPFAVMPRLERGIQYSRGVSTRALTSLEYWIARSSRATTPSVV
jgi:hypothetical protein